MKTIIISLFTALIFLGCQETTKSPIITDITSIQIDPSITTVYPTQQTQLLATVTHLDGSTGDATDAVTWDSNDTSILSVDAGLTSGGYKNGGDVNISISYADFEDTITLSVVKLTDFNITNADINTSGDHALELTASFEDGNSSIIYENTNYVKWDANNSATFNTVNGVTTINILTGTTEVNATLFYDDNETSITKTATYTIN